METGSLGTPASAPIIKVLQQKAEGIPADLHYFNNMQSDPAIDSPWPDAKITLVDKPIEVVPGIFLFKTVSENKGTLELNELSMAIKTPQGLAVLVGCSHPGIEKILATAAQIDPKIYAVVGGLHLVDKSNQQATEIAENFKSKWKLERIAAGHCTGEFAQVELERVFKDHHDHSGVGEVIALPM